MIIYIVHNPILTGILSLLPKAVMLSWSLEAILALISLLATCIPLAVYLWRRFRRRYSIATVLYGMDVACKRRSKLSVN
jgi:peptidoglycan/LPS O-acetylase OafA/YrhL